VLWALVAILVAIWLIGVVAHIAGALINVVLVLAIVIVVARLLSGRRSI
jgi:hypothetical protein